MSKIFTLTVASVLALSASAQWTGDFDNPQTLVPNTVSVYGNALRSNAAGYVYYLYMRPNLAGAESEEDIPNVVYEWRLQGFDPQGNKLFGDLGKLISDYPNLSYSVVNSYMMVDRDNNAVFAVPDKRYGQGITLTAYKVSPTGEMLWGDEGVSLDGKSPSMLKSSTNVVQLENGSYVFSWNEAFEGNQADCCLQRVSPDGQLKWDDKDTRLTDAKAPYMYSWIVNGGDNEVIQVYSKGSAGEIYARRIDVTGEKVWRNDTRIYRAGWGNIPIWTIISVYPSGDGGVIMSWNDDRTSTGYEGAYLSYVDAKGKLPFTGASDEGDVRLSYVEGLRAFNVRAMVDPAGDGFICLWRECDRDQHFNQMSIQKVNLKGQLMWGEEGIQLTDLVTEAYGYPSVCPGAEGQASAFFMSHNQAFGDTDILSFDFDTSTGEALGTQPQTLTNIDHERGSLEVANSTAAKCWYLSWSDDGPLQGDKVDTSLKNFNYIQRLEYAGSSSIKDLKAEKDLKISYFAGQLNLPEGSDVKIYNAAGALVASFKSAPASISWTPATHGVFIAKATNGEGTSTIKIVK